MCCRVCRSFGMQTDGLKSPANGGKYIICKGQYHSNLQLRPGSVNCNVPFADGGPAVPIAIWNLQLRSGPTEIWSLQLRRLRRRRRPK